MAVSSWLLIGSVATLFVVLAVLFKCAIKQATRFRLRSSQGIGLGERHEMAASFLRNGFRPFIKVAQALCQRDRWRSLFSLVSELCREKDIVAGPVELCSCALLAMLTVFLATGLISGTVLGGVACLLLAFALAATRLRAKVQERNDALREAVPAVLQSMGACSQSGLSLEQTLRVVSEQSQSGMRALFERSVHVLAAGGSTPQALQCLRGSAQVPELAFVSVALDVQHQTGGSMKQVLDAARDMVEGELESRRSLRVQTAQARLSARVVTVMPFLMMALLSLLSQDFLTPFFGSPSGIAVLAVALAMQGTGVLLVRRMLKVGD